MHNTPVAPLVPPVPHQVGEYISVSSQRDAEKADIEQERLEQLKGPEAQVGQGSAAPGGCGWEQGEALRWGVAGCGTQPGLPIFAGGPPASCSCPPSFPVSTAHPAPSRTSPHHLEAASTLGS